MTCHCLEKGRSILSASFVLFSAQSSAWKGHSGASAPEHMAPGCPPPQPTGGEGPFGPAASRARKQNQEQKQKQIWSVGGGGGTEQGRMPRNNNNKIFKNKRFLKPKGYRRGKT